MPLHHEYKDAIFNNSKVADLANVTNSRFAGSNTAAEFLHIFAEDTNFIHADIAGSNEYHKEFIPILLKTMLYLAENFK
jgi:leucyl aminopeptidase